MNTMDSATDKHLNTFCHVCGETASFLLKKEEYSLYKCSNCGLVFVYPLLTDEHLQEEIYSSKSGYQGNRKGDLVEFIECSYNGRFESTLDYLDKTNVGKKILDVGCSNGEFLYLAKQRGYETYGVELNQKTANTAIRSGINVFIGFLKDANFRNDYFDHITLSDVIEHVSDPGNLLEECKRILRPGGTIIIKTPNMDCFWPRSTFWLYRLFRIPWSFVTPPHHLYYFSINNLRLLLDKFSFSVRDIWFDPAPPLMYELGSLHLVRRYKRNKTLFNLVFAFFSFSIYTVLRGIDYLITPIKKKDFEMTFVCEKAKP